ncbi:hypothetical protein BDN72DRAFT_127680 [Pluteus cervinus]|uniref:Uncharacterized protein n=1 Tax=Pluteus cervinus TaxID=181527 RepID=A0ACD3AM91_9AGAR|nr:hypothetical protein BDN72DRAFT_127680 [Pluteus cervinus]
MRPQTRQFRISRFQQNKWVCLLDINGTRRVILKGLRDSSKGDWVEFILDILISRFFEQKAPAFDVSAGSKRQVFHVCIGRSFKIVKCGSLGHNLLCTSFVMPSCGGLIVIARAMSDNFEIAMFATS